MKTSGVASMARGLRPRLLEAACVEPGRVGEDLVQEVGHRHRDEDDRALLELEAAELEGRRHGAGDAWRDGVQAQGLHHWRT